MWRDLERTCAAMGVPFKRPDPFPQPSLLAARVALALEGDERSDFSRRVFVAEFGQGLPIGERATLSALLEECGVEPGATLERGRRRGQQGAAQGRMRPRDGARNHRRAVSRDRGRRGLLGQRPARTGPRLGGEGRRRRVTRLGQSSCIGARSFDRIKRSR